jgi:hypothetical protein
MSQRFSGLESDEALSRKAVIDLRLGELLVQLRSRQPETRNQHANRKDSILPGRTSFQIPEKER